MTRHGRSPTRSRLLAAAVVCIGATLGIRAMAAPPAALPSWATRAAHELVVRGAQQEARHELLRALSTYNDAVRMDGSYGPALIAVGRVRELIGDVNEAERAYSLAARLPGEGAHALTLRARLRKRTRRSDAALRDLERAVELAPEDARRIVELASWYVERRAWSAALLRWRRVAALAHEEDLRQHADTQSRALRLLAGETDPVGVTVAGGFVRRSLDRIAAR